MKAKVYRNNRIPLVHTRTRGLFVSERHGRRQQGRAQVGKQVFGVRAFLCVCVFVGISTRARYVGLNL